jgi:hypothetical protein
MQSAQNRKKSSRPVGVRRLGSRMDAGLWSLDDQVMELPVPFRFFLLFAGWRRFFACLFLYRKK